MLFTAAAAALLVLVQGSSAPVANPAATAVPTSGTITIASIGGQALTDQARAVFGDAVERALAAKGFTLLPDAGHGRYVAKVTVDRRPRGVVTSRRAGGGAPSMSLNGGISVGLPAGGDRLGDLVVTELTVTIAGRSDARVVWTGSAVTARVSGTPAGGAVLVAQTLADAVMAQFPARTRGPISIP
ncbi:DUF4136 domain-containing protein [Sphingomonas sp. Mn802worker]|uniref:DUF4136 domain-containing protein n=1 Tax=Sphingomonas sp. Mn802worker TaxID=629773 RepID=UPI0003702709|nr:DUF4136 domain-containing protein [Sphingomonas sp. Mn802worker]